MRAREMHTKLDKLAPSFEDDEHTIPDVSLLSPEDQDWMHEMFGKVRDKSISDTEAHKLCDLLRELPSLGPGEHFQGPCLEIPRGIETHFQLAKWHEEGRYHWPRFDFFHKLKAAQKVRFVELCRQYGWEGEYPRDRRSRHRFAFASSGGIRGLLPLSQWAPEDEAELRSLMDAAQVQ